MRQDSQQYARRQIQVEIKPIKRPVTNLSRPGTWICKGLTLNVAELRNNRLAYAVPKKLYGIWWLTEVFPEAVQRILAGENITLESFQKLDYYKYLVAKLHYNHNTDGVPSRDGLRHVWEKKFCDLVSLVRSIQEEGLKAPLDMYLDGKHLVLARGYRRLEILYQLGIKTVPVRVWRTYFMSKRFIPSASMGFFDEGRIHKEAVKQFVEYSNKSTDKYWVHCYTPYYDRHVGGRVEDRVKILELGIKEGMSLRLWHDAFPKGQVFGVDVDFSKQNRKLLESDRITCLKGDQRDLGFLKQVGRDYGPFDMIVDDALHRPTTQRNTYQTLWSYVGEGGVYVIEDLHPNYKSKYQEQSVMPLLLEESHKIWTTQEVKETAFYPNICFIKKA